MGFTISRTLAMPYDAALAATRSALADQGFGILTEMKGLADTGALDTVAADARQRLTAAMAALSKED